MADDKKKYGDADDDLLGDSGLGNLPPLSDFDSQTGFLSDSGSLPPLGSFDSASDEGGLPPISNLDIQTPAPPRRPPAGATPTIATPTKMDTPATGFGGGNTGFQDLAADSDFSPETPEIGPGPDNVDTPMFDSAFGGEDRGFDFGGGTPAPTQAMETPMFGGGRPPAPGGGGGFGFDDNAFDLGTPAPDFSPDTGMGRGAPPMMGSGMAVAAAGPPRKESGKFGLGMVIGLLVALLIGALARPFGEPYLGFLPNPQTAELEAARAQAEQLQQQLDKVTKVQTGPGGMEISEERVAELTTQISQLTADAQARTAELQTIETEVATKSDNLAAVEQDLADRNEEFLAVQEAFEDLQNETAIVQARQKGLASEVDRLTGLVGELEDANIRRTATKEALEHSIDRLFIQVREGLPLTPEKFAHGDRVQAVENLRGEVAEAKWVTPALLQAYTDLYVKELQIAGAEEYFFAKMNVSDELGTMVPKWSECLMVGNQAVYYRSLDGKNVGMFTNVGNSENPTWGLREDLPQEVKAEIQARVFASRVPGFEQKLQALAEKELASQEGSTFQRAFSSL